MTAAAAPSTTRRTGVLAYQARLAFAAIDPMLKLEKTLLSIRIHVIGNRRSAERNRLAQHLLHRLMQLAQLIPRDRRRPPARTDAGPKQRFVGIDIADARSNF